MRADQGDPLVVAVLVTYNISADDLVTNLAECTTSMQIVICDNSEDEDCIRQLREFACRENLHYLSMRGNHGIGYAQNRGIEFAKELNAKYILLLDDDSKFTHASLMQLVDLHSKLTEQGVKCGAVCGIPVETESQLSTVRNQKPNLKLCRDMMSSGSLIPLTVLNDVGLMDEPFFMNFLDYEWGWRAISKGYRIYLAEDVKFLHALGEGPYSVLGFKLKLKNPVHHYYQTRNTLQLLKRSYVPWAWKVRNLFGIFARCAAFSLLVPPRGKRFGLALRGFRDGLFGIRMGRLS